MGRVSQAQAQENRARVVAAASRLFREQGTDVSVADVMKAVGLTHGGFYKQFASKEALVAEATTLAFDEQRELRARQDEAHAGRREDARQGLIDWYLSAEHRDCPADGCPSAGLAADMARDDDAQTRHIYADGVREFADWLATEGKDDGLARLATLAGAILLARATEGTPLSDEFLTAARQAL
ncbi:TetR/AcrR family transcriptional regulator [Kutzneria sp. CA-103260]|uniref:TetR/AcrR family transcriptional regulator n=1 Tax=Kutzneria sp. CA-103260 TaxID=2802641 RepID=UPI001BA87D68|nr:TetR family transcriptional regulator [Kutzneria sp. CA-103260]QUQ71540.1 TetR family transcriptional regulator [Kutzneria sp. CA-103260]